MHRLNIVLSGKNPVSLDESEITETLKEWYLKHILDYTDQCLAMARILLLLSVAGIAAVTYSANQLPEHLRFMEMSAHIAFASCILLSSATYFPFGLKVSTDVDVHAVLRFISGKDYVLVAISVFCFLVGIGLTFVIHYN